VKIVLLFLASLSLAQAHCEFPAQPVVLISSSQVLIQYWDLPSQDLLTESSLPKSDSFQSYQQKIRDQISVDTNFLLQRYLKLNPTPGDAHNILQTVGRPQNFKPIGCLEALLLEVQINRNPQMTTNPTEFLAAYLQKDGRLKVYFLTNDEEGLRGVGLDPLKTQIAKDLKLGWKYISNLHNHSFFLEGLSTNKPQGVLAPSEADMQLFKSHQEELGLQGASITNGFETVHISTSELSLYRAVRQITPRTLPQVYSPSTVSAHGLDQESRFNLDDDRLRASAVTASGTRTKFRAVFRRLVRDRVVSRGMHMFA